MSRTTIEGTMVNNIKIKIVETHDEILCVINKPINTLINFDWHSGYPVYPDKILNIDQYDGQVDRTWCEHNWAVMLANKGYIKKYVWIFPHNYAKTTIKRFDGKNGNCEVYNIRLFDGMKTSCRFIIINMDFFGCKNPIKWEPEDRNKLLKDILNSLNAKDDLTLIISKSKSYVNYDVDEFLQDVMTEISFIAEIDEIL